MTAPRMKIQNKTTPRLLRLVYTDDSAMHRIDQRNGSNVESVTCNGTTERERKKQIRYIRTAARTSFVLIKVLNKDELKSSFFQNLSSEFSLGVFVGYPVVIRVVQSAT